MEFSKLEKTQRHDLIIRFRNDDYLRISSVEYSDFLTIKPFLQMHLDDFDELLDGIN